jgi:NAD(P)-dependent dehydrogenase (short-subunit alcohol dehydrogenase family)
MKFDGKVCIITDSSKGIGRAMVGARCIILRRGVVRGK